MKKFKNDLVPRGIFKTTEPKEKYTEKEFWDLIRTGILRKKLKPEYEKNSVGVIHAFGFIM